MTYDPKEAAACGAALLDDKVPGWANKLSGAIHDGLFCMTDWDHCVVGTLELTRRRIPKSIFELPFSISFNGITLTTFDVAQHYGFLTTFSTEWEALENAWVEEVDKRR